MVDKGQVIKPPCACLLSLLISLPCSYHFWILHPTSTSEGRNPSIIHPSLPVNSSSPRAEKKFLPCLGKDSILVLCTTSQLIGNSSLKRIFFKKDIMWTYTELRVPLHTFLQHQWLRYTSPTVNPNVSPASHDCVSASPPSATSLHPAANPQQTAHYHDFCSPVGSRWRCLTPISVFTGLDILL